MPLVWAPLSGKDLSDLQCLARSCLEADGGLPQLASAAMLRSRFLNGPSIAAHNELGELVAAAAVERSSDDGSVTTSGMVHPSYRAAGLGEALLTWAEGQAAGAPLRVSTESLAPGADRLYTAHGLVRTFAETVMRRDLKGIPHCELPSGVRTAPFGEESAPAFYAAYVGSFADRPGFPHPSAEQWLRELRHDHDFHPDLSRVALDEAGDPAGFVTVSDSWIDQVGVVPAWRGRGLGAYLTARSLTAIAGTGARHAWLAVNTDNPAARALYERLGFTAYGTRARYARPDPGAVRAARP